MPYDEGLAQRIREALQEHPGIVEKKMFGGLAFMSRGNMFVGVLNDVLMARVGPDGYAEALARPHVRVMDFTGRPMSGYVFVDPAGVADDAALSVWVAQCLGFCRSLPAK
jgi:hypothetical protein